MEYPIINETRKEILELLPMFWGEDATEIQTAIIHNEDDTDMVRNVLLDLDLLTPEIDALLESE